MNKPYFLYVGNAYPHKNLNRLIEAIVLLNKGRKIPVILKISCTKNVFTERLRRTARSLAAEKYVELLGFVSDKDLPGLYKNSVAFVFPSLSEGFGLPGLEAITGGTILLASNIPVFNEVFRDNVIYFEPKDTRSISLAMERALNLDAGERSGRIETAQKFAKRYSWAKMAEETLRIYEEIEKSSHSLRPRQ